MKKINNETSSSHDYTSLSGNPNIYTSNTISLQDRASIKNVLSGLRDRLGVDVFRVRSSVSEVLNFVAKDTRVDVILLLLPAEFTAFNEGIASLAGQSGTFVDIPFLPLLQSRGSARAKYLRVMSKAIENCLAHDVNILCSSFASNLVELKGPWQKAVVLHELIGLSKQECKKIVFTNTQLLVNKNAGRLQGVVVLDDDREEVDSV